MAKLRHIAIAVPEIQATAKFYEASFGMHRVRESNGIDFDIVNFDHAARVWRIPV
jgi:catechol 2,3-dioxygenase-like lactoylglutathione lyase family enzyme